MLFCNYIMKKSRHRILFLALFLPVLPLAALKLIGAGSLKRIFLSFLYGLKKSEIEELSRDFVKKDVMHRMYPEMLEEVKKQKKAGARLILNTASPSFYVKYIAEELGFDACYATPIRVHDVMPLLPKLDGRNNKGLVKIVSMLKELPDAFQKEFNEAAVDLKKPRAYFPVTKIPHSAAFSDSPADLPMLRIAESGTLVNPSSEDFIQEGQNSGWTVRRPPRPYSSSFGEAKMYLQQIAGLYE